MSLFTDTMTVYNYICDDENETEVWKRTVISGVQWSHNKTETTVSGGVQTEKKVESITIDFQRSYGNEKYVDPVSFAGLDDKTGYWTLNSKAGQDVLVLGKSDKEISKSYKLSQLREDFQYCGTVTSVSDNRNRGFLKNIRVVAE